MIELYEFNRLPINERANYLWANGTFIMNVKQTEHSFNLYTLNSYYVEVKLLNSNNEIVEIVPFKQGERLNKYLDFINVLKFQ